MVLLQHGEQVIDLFIGKPPTAISSSVEGRFFVICHPFSLISRSNSPLAAGGLFESLCISSEFVCLNGNPRAYDAALRSSETGTTLPYHPAAQQVREQCYIDRDGARSSTSLIGQVSEEHGPVHLQVRTRSSRPPQLPPCHNNSRSSIAHTGLKADLSSPQPRSGSGAVNSMAAISPPKGERRPLRSIALQPACHG